VYVKSIKVPKIGAQSLGKGVADPLETCLSPWVRVSNFITFGQTGTSIRATIRRKDSPSRSTRQGHLRSSIVTRIDRVLPVVTIMPISYRFQDIRRFRSKKNLQPLRLTPPLTVFYCPKFCNADWAKTGKRPYDKLEKFDGMCIRFGTILHVGQMDNTISISSLCRRAIKIVHY